MDPKHLNELIAVEGSYWWHIAKRELATEVLHRHFPPPGRLVEGGIGGGGNLAAFRRAGYHVTGFDIMEQSVRHCRTLGLEAQVHDLHRPGPLRRGSRSMKGARRRSSRRARARRWGPFFSPCS